VDSKISDAEAAYCSELAFGASQLGVEVSPAVVAALGSHYTLMCRWAARINLTSVIEPQAAAHLHGLDCLLFSEFFDKNCEASVSDVGSGAGFPGIVLALSRPKLRLCLVEPLRKKASFLKVALVALSRPDVQVRQDKLVACSQAPWLTDTIVSRATIAPASLLKLAVPYLEPGGRLITTSGDQAIDHTRLEQSAQDAGFVSLARKEWRLPGGQTRILDEFTLSG
jgi:16S rRNA (guanine527-N7)-methyltransferase